MTTHQEKKGFSTQAKRFASQISLVGSLTPSKFKAFKKNNNNSTS